MKKLLLIALLAATLLPLRMMEVSAWPGFLSSSTASAACTCVTNWTAPSGNIIASTSLGGATLTNGSAGTSSASPDCGNNAFTFVENTSNGLHNINPGGVQTVSLSGAQITLKLWIAQGVGTRLVDVQIYNQGTGYLFYTVNPSTGAFTLTQNNNGFASSVSYQAIPVYLPGGPGWEVVISAAGVTATTLNIIFGSDNAGTASYTGDGVSGPRYWGYSLNTP